MNLEWLKHHYFPVDAAIERSINFILSSLESVAYFSSILSRKRNQETLNSESGVKIKKFKGKVRF